MSDVSYYSSTKPAALQQGDICLAPIVRLEAAQGPAFHPWGEIDQHELTISPKEDELQPVRVRAGYAPVMILTHDCQMDKDSNAAYQKLRSGSARLSKADALQAVREDANLDRFVTVAPILPISLFRTGANEIKSGQALGYFYLPKSDLEEMDGESAVDLTYMATIDRHLLIDRAASLTEEARAALKLSLARLFALRSPEIGFEVEAAVGKRIVGLRKVPNSPAEIILELKDGSEVRLILSPEISTPEEPSVRAPINRKNSSRSRLGTVT